MRNAITIILLFKLLIPLSAQEFNTHWIYAPQADSLSHIWFRKAYISEGKPRQTSITVATTGYYKLYVNECNVGTVLYYPLRTANDTSIISQTFDITPYLRPDTNVVAIVYSAPFPSFNKRQISVNIYGTDYGGRRFSHVSDASWLCRRANSCMTESGGETIDGRLHDVSWKAATIYDPAKWLGAIRFIGINTRPVQHRAISYPAIQILKINSLANLHISQTPLLLRLAYSFVGFQRITLREAKRGEQLQIGNLTYICSGDMDEQAYPVFNISSHSAVSVKGDSGFKAGQITTVELVEVAETRFPNF